MAPETLISVIICTNNGQNRIPIPLEGLLSQFRTDQIPWELILVDNGSTDQTQEVVKKIWDSKVPIQILCEPRKGKSNALNTAIRSAQGELLSFLDDDGKPDKYWITNIQKTFCNTDICAVAGKVEIPGYLLRPWMKIQYRTKLASTEHLDKQKPSEMFGANMAISRKVLSRVPFFDPELGPGALGFGEDSLFSSQVKQSGFNIHFNEHLVVEHHFNQERLMYPEWIKHSKARGESKAYIYYHWEHVNITHLEYLYFLSVLKLVHWRLLHPRNKSKREGCSLREMRLVEEMSFLKRFKYEATRNKLYDYHGLVKKDSVESLNK